MITIAVDAMGGGFRPGAEVHGAVRAAARRMSVSSSWDARTGSARNWPSSPTGISSNSNRFTPAK